MKHKRPCLYLTLLILTLFVMVEPIWAQTEDTARLSLDSILSRIDRQNVKLQSYALRSESYRYQAKAATAWKAPMVGAGTFMTPYPGQELMSDADKGSLMFRLEQEIPNPGKQKAQAEYIRSQGHIEESGRRVARNELRAQAKSLYYNWLIAKKRIALLEESQMLIETMKSIETIRFEYNQSPLANVFKADAELEENRNQIDRQKAEIAHSRAWLNSLMNQDGAYHFDIDTLDEPAFQPQADLDTTFLAQQRGDIQRIDASIQSMQYGIRAMKNESKPSFKLQFDHMSALGTMMPNAYSIMGMLSIPLAPWSSKNYKNEVKAMQLNQEAMQQERESMLLESQGMLYGMHQEIKNTAKRIERMETKIIPALQRAFESTLDAYKENKQQLSTVLADWEALNMMRNNLLDEKWKRYQLIIDYEKALYQ